MAPRAYEQMGRRPTFAPPPVALALWLAVAVTVVVVLSVGLAACGAGRSSPVPSGRTLFAQACSACHSLSGTQSPRRQGGDLLGIRFSRAVMLQFVREMPLRRPLSPAELRAVSDYVVAVERRRG